MKSPALPPIYESNEGTSNKIKLQAKLQAKLYGLHVENLPAGKSNIKSGRFLLTKLLSPNRSSLAACYNLSYKLSYKNNMAACRKCTSRSNRNRPHPPPISESNVETSNKIELQAKLQPKLHVLHVENVPAGKSNIKSGRFLLTKFLSPNRSSLAACYKLSYKLS